MSGSKSVIYKYTSRQVLARLLCIDIVYCLHLAISMYVLRVDDSTVLGGFETLYTILWIPITLVLLAIFMTASKIVDQSNKRAFGSLIKIQGIGRLVLALLALVLASFVQGKGLVIALFAIISVAYIIVFVPFFGRIDCNKYAWDIRGIYAASSRESKLGYEQYRAYKPWIIVGFALDIAQALLIQNILHITNVVYWEVDVIYFAILCFVAIIHLILNIVLLIKLGIASRLRVVALVLATILVIIVHPFVTELLFWGIAVLVLEALAQVYSSEFRAAYVTYSKSGNKDSNKKIL